MSDEITHLKREVEILRAELGRVKREGHRDPYASSLAQKSWTATTEVPPQGLEAEAAKGIVKNTHSLDFNPQLNTFLLRQRQLRGASGGGRSDGNEDQPRRPDRRPAEQDGRP